MHVMARGGVVDGTDKTSAQAANTIFLYDAARPARFPQGSLWARYGEPS